MAYVMKVPVMGESVVEGTINQWFVKVGDVIKKDQPLVELLTDKVNVSVPAEADGVLLEIKAKVGDVVPVGREIAVIGTPGEKASSAPAPEAAPAKTASTPVAAKAAPAPAAPVSAPAAQTGPIKLSPVVRRLIKEHGIDVSLLRGTGGGGRVTQKDVEDFLASKGGAASAPTAASSPAHTPAAAPQQVYDTTKRIEEFPLTRVRKLISDHMVKSVQTSPHVTTFDECDFTRLVEFRAKHADRIEKEKGVRVTFMPFIVVAAVKALKEYPLMNASMTSDKVIVKHYYNIGIAVARESGLIVPVIKAADQKGIIQIMKDLKDLGDKARSERLMPADIEDGTFSLTNAGGYGALNSTPIISQPQVAILGIHAIQKRPVVRDNQIVIREMMNMGLSFDHRLIDGHYAVQFLRTLIGYIEEPELLLM
ncbi:MAG: 2-oxo acid dehydrogenase subunit E2 [bacterium]|nr:2-oxo acid dehydrogenase subunit E2 [bacterium]